MCSLACLDINFSITLNNAGEINHSTEFFDRMAHSLTAFDRVFTENINRIYILSLLLNVGKQSKTMAVWGKK